MIEQKKAIQQLWYTWSDIGIDAIRAGFRIRAASEGLSITTNEHVKSLGRYQRYFLPQEADPSTHPAIAPVCLSFIIQGEDRILVHKAYTGKDALGRDGVFFTHLLDNLPEDFSATDAISLWKSPFWQKSDDSLRKQDPDPFSTNLSSISYEAWKKAVKTLREEQAAQQPVGSELDTKDKKKREQALRFEEHLSYLVWTYLVEKDCIELTNERKELEKIYIAAPDSYLALLISGLMHCLPEAMIKDLTFSTYENDVRTAPTEIVGTCWLSTLDVKQVPPLYTLRSSSDYIEHAPEVRGLLPSSYYSEKLALNCYTGEQTPLKNFPLPEHMLIASECVPHATRYFLYGDAAYQAFLNGMADSPPITVDEFLKRYKMEVLSAQNPSQKDVEFALANSDLRYAAKMLAWKSYQQKIIDLALNESGWWDKFARQHITRLRTSSANLPQLARSLSQLAYDAIPYARNIIEEAVARIEIPQGIVANDRKRFRLIKNVITRIEAPQEVAVHDRERFRIIKEVIQCSAPPAEESGVWIDLLKDLRSVPNVFVFFHGYWECYGELMTIWSTLLSLPLSQDDYKLVESLLSLLSWMRFGDFLVFGLPLDWNERATATLLSQTKSLLNGEIVASLQQHHHSEITAFLGQLSQDPASFMQVESQHPLPPAAQPWQTAAGLFALLASSGYAKKAELLSLLLNSPMGRKPGNAENLLTLARLITTQEIVSFLKANGPHYLPAYEKMSATVLNMFGDLAKSNDAEARAGKKDVLKSWLNAPQLSSWLGSLPSGEKHLTKILKAAHLNTKEIEWFFLEYGKNYIALYPSSPLLLDLFDTYGRTSGERRKEFLFYWLDLPELSLATFEQALRAAYFNKDERIQFIERHGSVFLLHYPQSQVLFSYIQEYLEHIKAEDLDIFQNNFSSPDMPSSAERFLGFLLGWSELDQTPKPMINDYYQVAQVIRKPALLNPTITECAGRLLAKRDLPAKNRDRLMKKLAIACLEGAEMPLIPTMTTLSKMLPPKDIQSLHQNVAGSARDGIHAHYYTPALLVPLTRFALTFFPKAAQEEDLRSFLGTLLERTDERTLRWLDKEAKKWPAEEAARWRWYRRLPPPDKTIHWWKTPPWILLPQLFKKLAVARPRLGKPLVVIAMVMFALLLIVASATLGFLLVTGRVGPPATTVTPPPTSTPQGQELFASSIQGTPVLTLNTTSHSKASVWNASGGFCSLRSAGYVALASLATQPLSLCLEHTQHFRDNFAYQARVSVDADGYGGGLVLFYTSGSQPYYRFALLNGGQYSVILVDPSSGPNLLKGPKPLPVRWQAGQPYLFTVIVQNQEAYFYIGTTDKNSTLVYQGAVNKTLNASTNADFLGIYASIYQNAETTITVSSLKVWNLPPGQKSPLPGNSPCHSELTGMVPPCSR